MDNDLIIVFVTCPEDKAENIAETLISEKYAACVNISPVKSVYIWQEKLCKDGEALLIIKSTSSAYPRLEDRIKQIHPYDVPEIVALKADAVQPDYLAWVKSQISSP
ncbi:MAG: divalent-cation tolerance protein CutA [candidate division Zixibacteria bacterium]|nr:divalent-cation tolerance protein CutA [candidate division Zixibacteria bacterium]